MPIIYMSFLPFDYELDKDIYLNDFHFVQGTGCYVQFSYSYGNIYPFNEPHQTFA